jgi:NADPH:quinone reductase-like Zn-dependent oxidoreductase
MKAIRLHARGGAEQIVYEEAPFPKMQPGDALVKVLASGVTRNELDWGPTYTDEQGIDRFPVIPGHELCGIVEELSPDVSDLKVGEVVYGLTSFFRNGTAAQYVATRAADLAPKPATLSPTRAAAVPLSALTAWQALFDHGGLQAGQKVLVHGAAGGVGTFAIQIARWCGAHVVGAGHKVNLDLIARLGASYAIDYGAGPFERHVRDVDIILDTIGGEIQSRSWGLLRPGGIMISIAGESITIPPQYKDRQGVFFIVKASRPLLIEIGRLIDQGDVQPIIAAVLQLREAEAAFKSVLRRDKQGKVVLQVE